MHICKRLKEGLLGIKFRSAVVLGTAASFEITVAEREFCFDKNELESSYEDLQSHSRRKYLPW